MANALRDTRRISHGNPYDKRNTADVWQGVKDAYINSIQAAPEWLLEQMAPQDQYTPGELRETPRGAVRSLGYHREQDIAQRSQDIGRDYEQGLDYGTGLGMVADPYIDGPFALAGAMSKFGKLAHPAKRGSGNALSRLVRDETGSLGGRRLSAGDYENILRAQRKTEGYVAAVKDPSTGKVYTGYSHQQAINSAPHGDTKYVYNDEGYIDMDKSELATNSRLFREWDDSTDNVGFINNNGDFVPRKETGEEFDVWTMEDLRDLRNK